jgi:hypothetical protein
MISGGYLSLPQPLPEGEEFSDRHCYEEIGDALKVIAIIKRENLPLPGEGIKR